MRILPLFLLCSFTLSAIPSEVWSEESRVEQIQTVITNSTGTRMRLIEGGRFVQGMSGGERALERDFPLSTTGQYLGNAEAPAHVTWITKPYYLAETEVTVAQFKKFVEATGYQTSAEKGKTEMVGWDPTPPEKPLYQSHDFSRKEQFSWKNPGFEQQPNHPVVGVSYTDAKAYCAWLGKLEGVTYRLPTEAEWELACRAGTTTHFSFGDQARNVVHQYGNLGNAELEKFRRHAAERQWLLDWENSPEDGFVFTAPVGHYKANPWGFHDMHGNVWEWCEDLWLDTAYKEYSRPAYNKPAKTAVNPVNRDQPQTPSNDFHTIRGGCWYNGDLPCRSSNRTYWDREDAACYVGFRLVREADPDVSKVVQNAHEKEKQAIDTIRAAGGNFYSSRGIDIEIRFEGEHFNEQAITALSYIPNLERLRIGWRSQEERLSQQAINAISTLSSVTTLDFGDTLDPKRVDLSQLGKLPHLEVLRFPRSQPLDDNDLQQLSRLTKLKEFQCFGTNGRLTDKGIAQLSGNREMERLLVFENDATGDFLKEFIGCPLVEFQTSARYNADGRFTDEGTAHLASFPKLQSVSIKKQPSLSGRTVESLSQLSNLRKLQLERCSQMQDADFSMLSQLSRLQEIELTRCRAGDLAATAIAQIPRVRKVRIESDNLTDKGVRDLSKAFSTEYLYLDSSSITDEGVHALGRVNRLRNLDIISNQVTGTGLGPICELPNLTDLSLVTPALTDAAFDHLSHAKNLLKIRLAHRGHRPPSALTNDGLMKMKSATWLKELWLPRNGTGMTEEQMLVLKKDVSAVIPYTVSWEE